MAFFQRTLPLAIAMVSGLLGILTFYIPVWEEFETRSAIWFRIVFAFAMILGIHSLLHMHWGKVRRQQSGWAYSASTIVAFAITLLFAAYNAGAGPFAAQNLKEGGLVRAYNHIYVPAGATKFSLLAFFIASAAYRTFRARSAEAASLLVAAICVMLGRVPIGAAISDYLPQFAQWLMDTPNMAARRGILIGVSLGAIATAHRINYGIECSWLGVDRS